MSVAFQNSNLRNKIVSPWLKNPHAHDHDSENGCENDENDDGDDDV